MDNPTLFTLLIIFLGLEFGSFANVCIFRWPREQSVTYPVRSYCPSCKKTIAWYDNFPVISFVLLRAQCRQCQAPISWRYPLIELAVPLLWILTYWRISNIHYWSDLIFLGSLFLFGFFTIVTTMTDIDFKIIPDQATYTLVLVGILVSPLNKMLGDTYKLRLFSSLIGVMIGGGVPFLISWGGEKILNKEVLGMGDVKLLAGIGAFVGWNGAAETFLLGSMIGGLLAALGLMLKKIQRHQYLPFGPFLNLASLLILFFRLAAAPNASLISYFTLFN